MASRLGKYFLKTLRSTSYCPAFTFGPGKRMGAWSSLLVKLPYKLFDKNARFEVCGNVYTEAPNHTKTADTVSHTFKNTHYTQNSRPVLVGLTIITIKTAAKLHKDTIFYVIVDFLTHYECVACLKVGEIQYCESSNQGWILRPYLSCNKHPLFQALSSDWPAYCSLNTFTLHSSKLPNPFHYNHVITLSIFLITALEYNTLRFISIL